MEQGNNNSDREHQDMDQEPELELDFGPDWARRPPQTRYEAYNPFRENRKAGTKRQKTNRNPRTHGNVQSSNSRTKRGTAGKPKTSAVRRPNRRETPGQQYIDLPPVEIRFFPAREAITSIVKKIRSGCVAYPLLAIARLAVKKPEACFTRIEVNRETDNLYLFQCRICGMTTCSEPALNNHMVDKHIEEFMEKGELGEVPSGNFACVAQCGLSGILLGPPNHHYYSEKIREIYKTKYPNMDIQDYKSRIRMLHDEEAIEKWKNEYATQPTYKPQNSSEEPMLRAGAEAYFADTIASNHKQKLKQASLPAALSLKTPDKGLRLAIERAWKGETRFPWSIMMAFRGAFRNMGLILFKPDKTKKEIAVTSVKPSPLPVERATEPIRELVLTIEKEPGITRDRLKDKLCPGASPDSKEARQLLSTLTWLIERGHIVEFFDGSLSLPPQGKQPEKNDS